MESKFTIKDLFLFAVLLAILVSIWFAMVQFDRQWNDVKTIKDDLQTQGLEQVEMHRKVQQIQARLSQLTTSGMAIGPANGDQPQQTDVVLNDAEYFYRLHAAREKEDFAHGDWFVDAFGQTVGKLTPLIATDAYARVISGYVLEPLIKRDPETFEWRPWIAKSWQVADDGLSVSFTLREDITFSDGEPLTSEDVVYTYDLIMNPDINAPALRSYYDNFESVGTDGPHRVVFHMKRPYFKTLEFTGGLTVLPKHFYEQFTPEQFNEMPGLLVGSGPYKLRGDPKQWQSGTGKIELVRNDRYWGPRPSFDRLVFREIPDETAELTSFRNREIDQYGITPEKYEQLSKDEDLLEQADLYVYEAPNFGYRYLGWNQKRKGQPTPFADKRVRQAMTLLTNRQEMAEQLMAGLAAVATGPFHHLGTQADPDIKPWPFDPDRARELLADAGWIDRDGDGVLENAEGQPFRFKLIYPAQSTNYQQMAFYLKDAYARAGILLEPDPTEWNTMLQRIDERDFDAITLGWTGNIEGDPKQIFHSDSMKAGGSNYISYSNPKLDDLIEEARITLDKDKRLAMWHEAHQLLHEDQPYTFLFFSKSPIFVDKRIRNVIITRSGMNDRVEMYVPQAQQLWTD